ncbi:hypothetical protein PCK2_000255, partial [Pneumocystis canis]
MLRHQDSYISDDNEDMDCPLCMEEMDLSDRNFKPCPCGYQDLNGRCPACRRLYSEETIEFKPLTAEEWKMSQHRKNQRKQKERERKELETINRKHLANMRVVQKNLVYVIGLSPKAANEELLQTLRGHDYFGQYGKIHKIVINKKNASHPNGSGSLGVYITYYRKEDAAKAIAAVDGSINDGRILRASYGTTKYCSTYLRNQPCPNPNCMYLHEPGEEADSFTREDLSTFQYTAKATQIASPKDANTLSMPSRSSKISEATPSNDLFTSNENDSALNRLEEELLIIKTLHLEPIGDFLLYIRCLKESELFNILLLNPVDSPLKNASECIKNVITRLFNSSIVKRCIERVAKLQDKTIKSKELEKNKIASSTKDKLISNNLDKNTDISKKHLNIQDNTVGNTIVSKKNSNKLNIKDHNHVIEKKPKKDKTKVEKKLKNLFSSVFLPSLSSGYISGTDDGNNTDIENTIFDKPKKNRRGQRAR